MLVKYVSVCYKGALTGVLTWCINRLSIDQGVLIGCVDRVCDTFFVSIARCTLNSSRALPWAAWEGGGRGMGGGGRQYIVRRMEGGAWAAWRGEGGYE